MSLSKSKCWHSNNSLHFLKCTVPLFTFLKACCSIDSADKSVSYDCKKVSDKEKMFYNIATRLADTPLICSDPILCYIQGKLYLGILTGSCVKIWIYDPNLNVWNNTNYCSKATHTRQPFLCTNTGGQ